MCSKAQLERTWHFGMVHVLFSRLAGIDELFCPCGPTRYPNRGRIFFWGGGGGLNILLSTNCGNVDVQYTVF